MNPSVPGIPDARRASREYAADAKVNAAINGT